MPPFSQGLSCNIEKPNMINHDQPRTKFYTKRLIEKEKRLTANMIPRIINKNMNYCLHNEKEISSAKNIILSKHMAAVYQRR